MPLVVEVAFKGNRKEFFHWEGAEPLPPRAPVIVEADRGEDLGYVHALGEQAEQRMNGVPHAPLPEEGITKTVRRVATSEEVQRVDELRSQDESARRKAIERVRANGLQMKLTDAEWRWDRRKLTIYFTAEKRVDFRTLVRELASMFRTRIELKQIGVRDEAKRLGGIGRCGREYCSASWLPELRPVNLGVARDQRLSLNPTQISGACGRLMCCLRYEHDFYVQQRKRFPKEGKAIQTSLGEERVVMNDIFRERVMLRNGEGETRIVPLADLRREWKNAPDRAVEDETPPIPYEGLSDEVLRMQDTAEMPAWLPRLQRAPRQAPRAPAPNEQSDRDRERPARGEDDPPPGLPTDATARSEDGSPSPSEGGARDDRDRRRSRRRRGRRGPGGPPRQGGAPPNAGT